MHEVIIREATIEDVESIVNVHIKSWQESYKGIISDSILNNLSHSKGVQVRTNIILSKDKSIKLVAVVNGIVIGFCDAGLIRDDLEAKGEVYAIYILENYKVRV